MDSHGWDTRYKDNDLVWSGEPNIFLPPLVEGLDVGSALDLACGEGRNAIWLARLGWDVTGVDFSAVGIEKARAIAGDIGVDWIVDDVTDFTPTKKFDLVLVIYVHLVPQEMELLFSRAISALSPGGTLIGVGHSLRNLTDGVGGPPYPEILWTDARIGPLIGDLDAVALTEVSRPVDGSEIPAIELLLHATMPQ